MYTQSRLSSYTFPSSHATGHDAASEAARVAQELEDAQYAELLRDEEERNAMLQFVKGDKPAPLRKPPTSTEDDDAAIAKILQQELDNDAATVATDLASSVDPSALSFFEPSDVTTVPSSWQIPPALTSAMSKLHQHVHSHHRTAGTSNRAPISTTNTHHDAYSDDVSNDELVALSLIAEDHLDSLQPHRQEGARWNSFTNDLQDALPELSPPTHLLASTSFLHPYLDDSFDDPSVDPSDLHPHFPGAAVNPDSMTYEQLLELEERIGVVQNGLSEIDLSRFPERVFREASSPENATCLICQEDFKKGDSIRTLPCFHVFHRDCIDKWLSSKETCPVCMKSVRETAKSAQ